MAGFDAAEQIILERSKMIGNKQVDIWKPENAIINIFEGKHFEDPDGLLPLAVRQMQKLREWARPKDHIPQDQFVNGMPDIATQVNGYEVMQK